MPSAQIRTVVNAGIGMEAVATGIDTPPEYSALAAPVRSCLPYNPLVEGRTTNAIQGYLDDLANLRGDAPAEPVVRALLTRAVGRLHLLCSTLLHSKYPRLTRPPLNLQSDELLSAVVERLIKAMRQVRPGNVRRFFAIVNQHMRWELNDLVRRLDGQTPPLAVNDALTAAPEPSASQLTSVARRILRASEDLPEEVREAFSII